MVIAYIRETIKDQKSHENCANNVRIFVNVNVSADTCIFKMVQNLPLHYNTVLGWCYWVVKSKPALYS